MQYGHWIGPLPAVVHPCIDFFSLWVTVNVEHFDDSFPHGLAFVLLFYRHTFNVRGCYAMQLLDGILERCYVAHAAASTKSPTLQNDGATPAAIAGAQHSLLCRLTRL